MGLSGISIWQLLIILAIVVLLFGSKRLRTIGGDLGSAIRGFRKSIQETEDDTEQLEVADRQLEAKTGGGGVEARAERKDRQTT